MEKIATIYTAKDLLDFLLTIPTGILDDLPIQMVLSNADHEGPVLVEAYEVRETEGCLERGFRLSTPEE